MKTRSIIVMLSAAGMVAALAGSAQGELITPSGVTASSQYSADYGPGKLIDDSGLSGSAPHTFTDTHSLNVPPNAWLSGNSLPQTVTFDLGAPYFLTDAHIWQYAHPNANWSKDITIEFSTTGTGGPWGSPVYITMNDFGVDMPAQNFNFGQEVEAMESNAVRFTITSRAGGSGSYVGLSEVKFTGTAVPEPTSFVLLGIGGLLVLLRRRRAFNLLA